MPTFEGEIIREARTVARLQAERRRLAKRLREIEKELRDRKRVMAKLVGALRPEVQMPPLRVYGEK